MSKVRPASDCLINLAMDLIAGRDISAESRQFSWLREGVMKYMQEGKQLSLDKALGLAVCGSRHVSTQLAQSVRNHFLVQSIRHISLADELSDWARCERLAPQVIKYCRFWDSHGIQQDDPDWDAWKTYLHRAWLTGIGIPTTARGLYLVIENDAYSLHSDELRMYETIQAKRRHESLVFNQGSR